MSTTMKKLPASIETATDLWTTARSHMPLRLLLAMLLSVAIAPAVQAASGTSLDRGQAWAIALLAFVTFGLAIYLFVVIFQPERF